MEAANDGISLATRLGTLGHPDKRKAALTQLVKLNATEPCKLSLDEKDKNLVWLSIERPYFTDERSLAASYDLLAGQRQRLLPKLQAFIIVH